MDENKKKSKFFYFVKSHKWQTAVCVSVIVLALGVGGVAIAQENLKIANTQKAIEMAEENGGISVEALNLLEENGGFAEFGTEIIDPSTGETVKLVQNEDGSISKVVVKDSNGTNTGNHAEAGHSHSFIPHYSSRTIQTGTKYVVDVPAQAAVVEEYLIHGPGNICNACGAFIANADEREAHTMATGHGGTHSCGPEYGTRVISPAVAEQGHNEPVYGTEQYVDYYYCSDCGARQ